jgi:hypothetical protein
MPTAVAGLNVGDLIDREATPLAASRQRLRAGAAKLKNQDGCLP